MHIPIQEPVILQALKISFLLFVQDYFCTSGLFDSKYNMCKNVSLFAGSTIARALTYRLRLIGCFQEN